VAGLGRLSLYGARVRYGCLRVLAPCPTRRSSDLMSGHWPTRRCSTSATPRNWQPVGSSTSCSRGRTLATSTATASNSSDKPRRRSEEHTSELQSRENLVCRLLLEKKKPTKLHCMK